jgi:glyoxylase-like metal-dependent hydrolase (beta-lactamase superfamily II)
VAQEPLEVSKDVYLIGGSEITHPADCSVYLLGGEEPVLIDCGAGESFQLLVENIEKLGYDPEKLKAVIATHAHIDHIGALSRFRQELGARVIAHELDAGAIESGEGVGAEFYGLTYLPCKVDVRLVKEEESLRFGGYELKALHIPGHTPGSLALYVDIEKRILFGQDVHGPYFLPGSDPDQARISLQKLIDLEADILCEGHFGIYQPQEAAQRYLDYFRRTL